MSGQQDLEAQMDEAMRDMQANMQRAAEIAEAEDIPIISAIVIAGDLHSGERSKGWVESGERTFTEALHYVGSFGRLPFLVWGLEQGHTTPEAIYPDLPHLWTSSDPRYAGPTLLDLWRGAHAANGGRTVRDGAHLPKGKTLRVYRGQQRGTPLGISWTLDLQVAEKFARGAATRRGDLDGHIVAVDVPRSYILAYLTGRNEAEVILDPAGITEVP